MGSERSLAIGLAALAVLMASPAMVQAGPPSPLGVTVKQPDGTAFVLYLRGDEFYSWNEDKTGYPVAKNENKAWVYVTEVDGHKIRNLKELVELVEKDAEPFVVFKNKWGHQIVLDREKAKAAQPQILATYRITEDRSPDLKNDLKN